MQHKPHNNNKGIALLMAMFTVVILSYLAVEISYEVAVEYRLSKNEYDDLKARYAAKSAAQISLLRIAMYKQVFDQFGNNISDPSMLDMIWNFPFSWPPTLPEEASMLAKDELQAVLDASAQDTQWTAVIESEGNKLDLNDLNSPSETLAKATEENLIQLLQKRLEQDDEWARDNRGLNIKEIVANIKDWVDPDDRSPHAGSEKSLYSDISEVELPPNADFKTMQELHMVAGVTDEIYNVIAPVTTVYGIKGINVNYADKKQLQAIDYQINEEVANAIRTRINDPDLGPFQSYEEFESFLAGEGLDMDNFNRAELPLRFGKEFNFRIKAVGMYGLSKRQIEAIVYDYTNAKVQLRSLLDKQVAKENEELNEDESDDQQDENARDNSNNTNNQETFDRGKPRVIFWRES